jgi:hypothetical protein
VASACNPAQAAQVVNAVSAAPASATPVTSAPQVSNHGPELLPTTTTLALCGPEGHVVTSTPTNVACVDNGTYIDTTVPAGTPTPIPRSISDHGPELLPTTTIVVQPGQVTQTGQNCIYEIRDVGYYCGTNTPVYQP